MSIRHRILNYSDRIEKNDKLKERKLYKDN